MLDHLAWIAAGVALCGFAWFGALLAKKGWTKAVAKVDAMWNGATKAIAADVAALKTDVAAIKTKVGV